jgi:hypothetical protein
MEIDSDRPDRPSLTHNPKSFGIHLVKWTGVGGEFWFPWPVVPYGFTPENGCEVNLVSPQRRFVALPGTGVMLMTHQRQANGEPSAAMQESGAWMNSVNTKPKGGTLGEPRAKSTMVVLHPRWPLQ